MKVSLAIALRYVFSKDKLSAINIISGISVAGLSIGTAALILVMSVFNGLSEVIGSMFNAFNPDIVVLPTEGKYFQVGDLDMAKIKGIEGVIAASEVLEDLALFTFGNEQAFGTLKGVDTEYHQVSQVASFMYQGVFNVEDGDIEFATVGIGMAEKLVLNIYDPLKSLIVYVPKTEKSGMQTNPFKSDFLTPGGIFAIQHEIDNELIYAPIGFVRRILQAPGRCSSIELKIDPNRLKSIKKDLRELLGEQFVIKDRYEQDEAFIKLQNLEKWISFAILTFTIFLIAFNLLGVLWMIAREKIKDISLLYAIGLTRQDIRHIFYWSSLLYATLSISIGFSVALFLYWIQKEIGIVRIPEGFAVSSYPVALNAWDFLAAGLAVGIICFLASVPAAYRASSQEISLRENR